MPPLVSINLKAVPPRRAKVSVFDRGFLYGDGVYEVVRTYGPKPFLLARHLRRLRRSAARIMLRVPWSDAAIGRCMAGMIARHQKKNPLTATYGSS